jgi:hypothetical protein
MKNWKGCGSGLGLIERFYPIIFLEGPRKTTRTSVRIASYQQRFEAWTS